MYRAILEAHGLIGEGSVINQKPNIDNVVTFCNKERVLNLQRIKDAKEATTKAWAKKSRFQA